MTKRPNIDDLLYQTAQEQTENLRLSALLAGIKSTAAKEEPAVPVLLGEEADAAPAQNKRSSKKSAARRFLKMRYLGAAAVACALLLCVPLVFRRTVVDGEQYIAFGGSIYIDGEQYKLDSEESGERLLLLSERGNQYTLIDGVVEDAPRIMTFPVDEAQPALENENALTAPRGEMVSIKPTEVYPVVIDLVVRSGPGTDYQELALLHAGQCVSMVGVHGNWAILEWGDGVAYAFSRYLYNAPEEVPAYAPVTKRATEELNVRLLPTSREESDIIGALSENEIVVCTGEIGNWVQITYNGAQAYVFGKYLVDVN
ncbi:SH3 domain-containing protein [Christensenellaceae bacterium OttesenSCG-928-L17]|nr:SH3 domain-containing protein [Christensenellaceae bacterium OttesenSCG-928-L17]